MSLADNVDFLRRLSRDSELRTGRTSQPQAHNPLVEVTNFGTNPGELKMLTYVPGVREKRPALVVVLHGCGQKAAAYDIGTGWSELAARYGFALLFPEQKSANNANTCFNWFTPADTVRDSGEPHSIRQMIAKMSADYKIDPERIYITGLSAGGAMASVMLATYPEVFAAGSIIAGLPYGVAGNLQDALKSMYRPPVHAADMLGESVRAASPHKGRWPRLSIWHGSGDSTVSPVNGEEIVRQWTDVHGLQETPTSEGLVDTALRQVWQGKAGTSLVESYTIPQMAHGTPIGVGEDDEQYGEPGPYLLAAGISSTWHSAKFFGLTGNPVEVQQLRAIDTPQAIPEAVGPDLDDLDLPITARAREIGTVITRALTAAGLIK